MNCARLALRGRGIVVTRPTPQAAGLIRAIEAAGGLALAYPMIEIRPLAGTGLAALVDALHGFDLAIFISRNAVEQGLAQVAQRREWPRGLAVAAVGEATRTALEQRGFAGVIAPPGGGGSEALLDLFAASGVRMPGRRVVIFRGRGGREHLGRMLSEQGALVQYAECYSRVAPSGDASRLVEAWSAGRVHAVTLSSGAALANLDALLGEAARGLLAATPLFVPHQRVADQAAALGASRVLVSGPTDECVVRALVAYFCRAS